MIHNINSVVFVAGKQGGLELVLDTEKFDYFEDDWPSESGFKLLLHQPEDVAFLAENHHAINLAASTQTNIAVQISVV